MPPTARYALLSSTTVNDVRVGCVANRSLGQSEAARSGVGDTGVVATYTSAATSAINGGPLCPIMPRHNLRSETNRTTPHPAMKPQP